MQAPPRAAREQYERRIDALKNLGALALFGLVLVAFTGTDDAIARRNTPRVPTPSCERSPLPTPICRGVRRVARPAGGDPAWSQSRALASILWRESRFNPLAINHGSGACGLAQFLPCRCYPRLDRQLYCTIRYVVVRYRTPARALAFHNAHGWW